ncbi:hypothetical protein BS78_01G502800 [Paspalum vaginatum]|nr:hypothetical protein BS78_01G502800 [Paspalum vaginatum]
MGRAAHLFSRRESRVRLVREKRRYVISDDLVIKLASTGSTHLLLQRIGSGTIGHIFDFEEIEVGVGWAEVVSLLKACLSTSKNVFTDTFLLKEADRCVRSSVNLSTEQNIQAPNDVETESSLPFNIKVFYDRHEKEIMYAECDHEFVDLLLSFLVYPVSCVIKNLGGTSHLGCSLDNLYGSAVDLHENNLLEGCFSFDGDMLLDPSIIPFFKRGCSPRFVDNGTYVVDDDLCIYQASAMLVMKHWCKREKDAVLEVDIAIGKQEAVHLLRAALTSERTLTNVFMSTLEDKFSQLPPLQPK